MLVNIIAIIIVLGFLIFFHELGHFIAAKLVGIRVERFSLGFPPRMIGKKIGET
ncbi:MAG: site-2 protease family protein, partial [Fidelibacterota bacterium]